MELIFFSCADWPVVSNLFKSIWSVYLSIYWTDYCSHIFVTLLFVFSIFICPMYRVKIASHTMGFSSVRCFLCHNETFEFPKFHFSVAAIVSVSLGSFSERSHLCLSLPLTVSEFQESHKGFCPCWTDWKKNGSSFILLGASTQFSGSMISSNGDLSFTVCCWHFVKDEVAIVVWVSFWFTVFSFYSACMPLLALASRFNCCGSVV